MSTKWDPFRDLITLQEHLNRIFDVNVSQHRHADGLTGWHPPSDISETADAIHLFVELAGVVSDDIDIKVDGNRLTLSGERRRPGAESGTFHQTEILMGPFHRTFILPSNVDPDGIEANYKHGLLEIVMPKIKKPATQTVDVKIK